MVALRSTSPQRSLPPCEGGAVRGVTTNTGLAVTPIPLPPPTHVGLARLAQFGAEPGQARVPWGREHTEFAATAVAHSCAFLPAPLRSTHEGRHGTAANHIQHCELLGGAARRAGHHPAD